MKTIEKQAISQSIMENISAYSNDYQIKEISGGVMPTEDCCCLIAQYITNEYDNNPECEKYDKVEYIDTCIDAFYKHLELSDADTDDTNYVFNYLKEEVKRYIAENN